MASICKIRRNNELVFGMAERWSSETNSFVFPWGESTITLEDMMVLGGFSVLGNSVLIPLEKHEMVEIEENLDKARKFIIKLKSQKAKHCVWLNYFMESDGELEHEAFLSLWLSRFVFPGNVFDTINKNVFSIAIYLARGTRIALAPTVLASLYRDLGLLRETLMASAKLKGDKNDEDNYLALSLWSPMQFVQVWAWERLPPSQPKPKFIDLGEPRLARWDGVKGLNIENVRLVLDSCGESYLWRPYAIAVDNWLVPKFYKEKEQWVLFSSKEFDEELESFARCLRVSELVGIDSIESYLPHRVAMQFGMDQDLPQWVHHSNGNAEIAWKNYTRPLIDAKIYVPSRLFESDVTTRYLEWWKKSVLDPQCAVKGVVRGKRSSRRSDKFSQRSNGIRAGNDADFPPGFHPKCNWGKGMLGTFNKPNTVDNKVEKYRDLSTLTGGNGALGRMEMLAKQMEMNRLQSEVVVTKSETASEIANGHETKAESPIQNVVFFKHEEEGYSFANELAEFEIESRISKLERVVAGVKAARFGCRCVKEQKTSI